MPRRLRIDPPTRDDAETDARGDGRTAIRRTHRERAFKLYGNHRELCAVMVTSCGALAGVEGRGAAPVARRCPCH